MDAELFAEELKRMCASYSAQCGRCEIFKFGFLSCGYNIMNYPKEAVAIVEKWSKEHPGKTNRDKFFEVFGIDPRPAGYVTNHNRAEGLATEWWDRPYEEPKEE